MNVVKQRLHEPSDQNTITQNSVLSWTINKQTNKVSEEVEEVIKDPICKTKDDITRTVNIFTTSMENLLNRENGTYKVIQLDNTKVIQTIISWRKQIKESKVKHIAYTMLSFDYKEDMPTLDECLTEETEYKLIQYRRTQEEQRAIEKSAIKWKYLDDKIEVTVSGLQSIKDLFFDFNRKWFATTLGKFSLFFASNADEIKQKSVYMRENKLKKDLIDKKINEILKEEQELIKKAIIFYEFYIKYLAEKNPEVFMQQSKISFKEIIPINKEWKYDLPVSYKEKKKRINPKNWKEEEYEVRKSKLESVMIKMHEKHKTRMITTSTNLDRKTLFNFMKTHITTVDQFLVMHISICEVIKQENTRIDNEKKEKPQPKKLKK